MGHGKWIATDDHIQRNPRKAQVKLPVVGIITTGLEKPGLMVIRISMYICHFICLMEEQAFTCPCETSHI